MPPGGPGGGGGGGALNQRGPGAVVLAALAVVTARRWSSWKAAPRGIASNLCADQNLFNYVNYNTFIGNQLSPFYGKATSAGPARRIELGVSIGF